MLLIVSNTKNTNSFNAGRFVTIMLVLCDKPTNRKRVLSNKCIGLQSQTQDYFVANFSTKFDRPAGKFLVLFFAVTKYLSSHESTSLDHDLQVRFACCRSHLQQKFNKYTTLNLYPKKLTLNVRFPIVVPLMSLLSMLFFLRSRTPRKNPFSNISFDDPLNYTLN